MNKLKINGIYRHFKGNLYVVIGTGKDCETLEYLPNITKWDIQANIIMTDLIKGCKSLKIKINIFKWRISKLKQKGLM